MRRVEGLAKGPIRILIKRNHSTIDQDKAMIFSHPELPIGNYKDHQSIDLFDLAHHQGTREFRRLLRLALDNDEEAWTQLYKIYEPGLRKCAKDLLGPSLRSEVDVDDIVQSVHWSLVTGLRRGKIKVDTVEALLAIGRTILRRKIARTWRTLERRRRITDQLNERFGNVNDWGDIDQSAHDPLHQVSAEEQFQRLCRIMTRTERRLIELRLLGYSTAGAAREMGRDSESLRMTLARLRSKLKKSGLLADFPTMSSEADARGRAL